MSRKYLGPCVLIASLAGALGGCYPQETQESSDDFFDTSPNRIILISIDTLRADRLGFMGYEDALTPNLDRLAAEGAYFQNFYATSSTTPMSMGSLMSGLHPFSHGFTYGSLDAEGFSLTQPVLSETLLLLPEFLSNNGHRGFGVATNPHLSESHGFNQGLEKYVHVGTYNNAWAINKHAPIKPFKNALMKDELAPFFWAHYMDPHDPWSENKRYRRHHEEMPPSDQLMPYSRKPMKVLRHEYEHPTEEDIETIQWLYSAEVSRVDHHVGQLLKELGADDNTLTIITADHGESFADHGPLGHGFSLYEDLTHVPLVIHWPNQVQAGQEILELASLVDVYPTIVDLLGYEVPDSLHGLSLVPLISGNKEDYPKDRAIYGDLNNKRREHALAPPKKLKSIRRGDYKFILDHVTENETFSLYNVLKDPGETRDLAEKKPKLTKELREALQAHRDTLPPAPNTKPNVSSDLAEIEALKAMGYIE